MTTTAVAATNPLSLQALCIPGAITAAWIASVIKPGERYAGIALAEDGSLSHHLFLLPGEADGVSWDAAVAWAAEVGGDLPTRREQSLLFANLKDQFKPRWYWSGEQYAPDPSYAWGLDFDNGVQFNGYDTSYAGRARAVRRLKIQ
ncbi:DUF1566 domain-containing protein [Janthinobacterium sp.]|uniref:DUF1566 domain-containing protein n=1 Tax=Janthinobacterium sp. TaxID=1871054 RepID=UPI00293D8753|nr:DUF1566 domain-containing protein [Janthinobacterium sp.]